MSAVRFEISLELLAPFLFKSGAALPLGLDAATLTNNEGAAVIPGSHLRGHLSHAWREFAALGGLKQAFIDEWLGSESIKNTSDEPKRGRLDFDGSWRAAPQNGMGTLGKGLWLSMPTVRAMQSADVPIRFRVKIDDDSGVADPGALQLIGQTHVAGSKVKFVGHIFAGSMKKSEEIELQRWIERALQWIPALGALKGIGFGQLDSFSVKASPIATQSLSLEANDTSVRRNLSFTLDRPFCFGSRKIADNRFESMAFVPGGALRGALFGWCQREKLVNGALANDACEILNAAHSIQIRHGWACKSGIRIPAVIPQSAVAIGDDLFVDASEPCNSQPFLVASETGLSTIPAFPSDWKAQTECFNKLHEFLVPVGLVEVRTAIDPKTGSALENNLFSLDCRAPADENGAYPFRSEIVLLGGNNQVLLSCLSRVLPLALNHLGKTEARAEQLSWAPNAQSTDFPKGDRLVLTLLSDALLSQLPQVQSGRAHATLPDYQSHFEQLSGGALELIDLYADQRLVGGYYFKKRYWSQEPHYCARVLTLAGSVFVFQIRDREKAAQFVNEWLQSGLPSADGDHYENNPYLPANGYGEIRIGTGTKESTMAAEKMVRIELGNAMELPR